MKLSEILGKINSVAIVGATPVEGKVGYEILRNIIRSGFKGDIYPVNPKYESILGIKAWPKVSQLPKIPSVVVIAVPPPVVPSVLEESAKKGVRLAVVITAGFKEAGNEALEQRLREIVRSYGIRVIGPNSAGISVTSLNLHASIEVAPDKGPIALMAQSGALGGVVISKLRNYSSGVSFFISLGNMMDVDIADMLECAYEDSNTEAVITYVEWLSNGRRFLEVASKLTAEKPLCILKGGWGERSSEAVRSHTGGLTSSYQVFKVATRKAGAYLAEDLDDLIEVCEVLRKLKCGLPGKRVLIVTNSGGLGVILASHLESGGIDIPPLSHELKERIAEASKKRPSGSNPIDFGGDAVIEQVTAALTVSELRKYYDAAVLAYVPTSAEGPEKLYKVISSTYETFVLPTIIYVDGEGSDLVIKYVSRVAPTVTSSRTATKVFNALYERYRYLRKIGKH